MRRGEYLEDRVDDLEAKIEEYFGEITGTEDVDGTEVFVVEDSGVFESVKVGVERNEGRKNRVAVEFNEKDVQVLQEEGLIDKAQDAMRAKNDFLEEVTGRNAKDRRESMKRDVEGSDADIET